MGTSRFRLPLNISWLVSCPGWSQWNMNDVYPKEGNENSSQTPHNSLMDDHEKDVNDGSYDGRDEEIRQDLSYPYQVPYDAVAQISNSIEHRWVEELSSHPVGGTDTSTGGLAPATLKKSSHSWSKPVALKHPTRPLQTKTNKQQPQSLQFVVENGKRRPDGLSRRQIRSQARRKVENKLERQTGGSHVITPWKEKAVVSLSRTTPGPGSGSSLRQGLWDPFDALPIDRGGKAQFLMHHFNASMNIRIRRSTSPIKEWLLFAVTDRALLHSVLCHAATDLSIISGKPLMLEGVYHKARAIEIINTRLKNGEEETSDASIAAVACLAYLECLTSSPAGVKVHMDGLEAIIKRRGGIETMRSNVIAWKFIFWVDACAAAVLKTKPRFIYPILTDADVVERIRELLAKIPLIRELLSRMQPNAETLVLYRQVRGIADRLA